MPSSIEVWTFSCSGRWASATRRRPPPWPLRSPVSRRRRLVGHGTGIDAAGLQRKMGIVQTALDMNRPDPRDPLDVLAKLGGFELAALAGAALAASARRRPVVIDGYPSTAAAMIAVALAPALRPYLIAAHRSQESGHQAMLDWLGLRPLLDLELRLGEGTGAVLALNLIEAACRTLAEMATFDQAGVSKREDQ